MATQDTSQQHKNMLLFKQHFENLHHSTLSVLTDSDDLTRYENNVSAFTRKISCVIRAQNKEQILEVVKAANKYQVKLHPISQGKNWGLGSKLPVENECAVLDLSHMNRILEVNEEFGYAVIEPGVTQGQISDYLKETNSDFFADSTGSARHTSILGNTLERGVAFNSLRANNVITLEVITGSGEVLKTGFAHYQNSPLSNINKFGVGPGLTELFFQSNFAIVVSATIELLPRPKDHYKEIVYTFAVTEKNLGRAIEDCRNLKRQGILSNTIHIANERRSVITFAPQIYDYAIQSGQQLSRKSCEEIARCGVEEGWVFMGAITGLPGKVKDAKKIAKRSFKKYSKPMFVSSTFKKFANLVFKLPFLQGTPSEAQMSHNNTLSTLFSLGINKFIKYLKIQNSKLEASKPFMGISLGIPTDAAIKSVYWPNENHCDNWNDPDQTHNGLLFSCPIIPMNKEAVDIALNIIKKIDNDYGVITAVSLNLYSEKSIEGVLSIDLDKSNADSVSTAHKAILAMDKAFIEAGFIPYRINIDNMHEIIDEKDSFWKIARDIKKTLDPNGIISPKRFSLE